MSSNFQLHTIEEAITDIKNGKIIIVVDDEDRENEGDFVAASESITPEIINFMAMHGRGLICAPLTEKRCKELELHDMVTNNTDVMKTAFTVSVDLIGNGVTTGISALDRAKTIQALVDDETKPYHLGRPGHIFPLVAKEGGVLRRTGHTEAAIDFSRLAGFKPAGVICEIMNEDGTMARLPQLIKIAKKFDLKIVSIENLVAYRMQHDSLIQKKEDFTIDTRFGSFRLRAYQQTTNNQVHIALTKGNWSIDEPILTRIHPFKSSYNLLSVLHQNPEENLTNIFNQIEKSKNAALVFINQYIDCQEVLENLTHIKNSEKNSTFELPKLKMDSKDYGIGAQILHDLNIKRIKLLSNTQQTKRVGMTGYGLEIVEYLGY